MSLGSTGSITSENLLCCISFVLPKDPVVSPNGELYDKDKINEWIEAKGTDPFTRDRMTINDYWPHNTVKKMIELLTPKEGEKDDKKLVLPERCLPDHFYGRFKVEVPTKNHHIELIAPVRNKVLSTHDGTNNEIISYQMSKDEKRVCDYVGFLDSNHRPDTFGQYTSYKDGKEDIVYTGCISEGVPKGGCVISNTSLGYVFGGKINEDGCLYGAGFYANSDASDLYYNGYWKNGTFTLTKKGLNVGTIHKFVDCLIAELIDHTFLIMAFSLFSYSAYPITATIVVTGIVASIAYRTIRGYLRYFSTLQYELNKINIEPIRFSHINSFQGV